MTNARMATGGGASALRHSSIGFRHSFDFGFRHSGFRLRGVPALQLHRLSRPHALNLRLDDLDALQAVVGGYDGGAPAPSDAIDEVTSLPAGTHAGGPRRR